jgi:hypothetical protein
MDLLALAAGAPPGGDGPADAGDGGKAQRSQAASRLGAPERAERQAADDARHEARQVALQLQDIEEAEAAAIGAHRQAQIERIKSAAIAKMDDIRNKSGQGVFDSYDDLLRDVWNKTADFAYQNLLDWLDNAAVQTLTSSHCTQGGTNVTLFIKMMAEWTRRASRTDLAHASIAWANQRFLPGLRGFHTIDGTLAALELYRTNVAAFPMTAEQEWFVLWWLILVRDVHTNPVIDKFGAYAVSDLTPAAKAALILGPEDAAVGTKDVDRPSAAAQAARGAAARAPPAVTRRPCRRARSVVRAVARRQADAAVLCLRQARASRG